MSLTIVDLTKLIQERDVLRSKWKAVRFEKLQWKSILKELPLEVSKKEATFKYRQLKKEQRKLSIQIKNIDKNISRALHEKKKE